MARTPTAEDAQRERTRAVTSARGRTLRWHLQKRAYLLMLVPGLGMYLIFMRINGLVQPGDVLRRPAHGPVLQERAG
jgi:hypothetical protein